MYIWEVSNVMYINYTALEKKKMLMTGSLVVSVTRPEDQLHHIS